MTSKQQYEYPLNTSVNYRYSNLAEYLNKISHDAISDFSQRGYVTAIPLSERVEPLLNDSVQNKQYSQRIWLVQRQYSSAEHGDELWEN